MRRLLLVGALALFACGPQVPKTKGTQKSGQSCASSSECENGLACVEQRCDFERCNSALDPQQWCALRLGVEPSLAQCDSGNGSCVALKPMVGGPCQQDEACNFGSICVQGACVETCVSSASCPISTEACIARAEGGAQRHCQPSPGCQAFEDAAGFCADALGLNAQDVMCDRSSGECTARKMLPGVACRFDDQCVAGSVCEQSRCITLCERDEDCAPDVESCSPRIATKAGRICQLKSCASAPDPDAHCVQELGSPDAYCDFDGECALDVSLTGQIILLSDLGAQPEICAEQVNERAAPGLDITYAMALDYDFNVLGYGRPVVIKPGVGPEGNDFTRSAHLDMTGVSLDDIDTDTGCLKGEDNFTRRKVLSLGCGGKLALEFFSQVGAPLMLTEDTLITIGEAGPVCGGASAQDRGEVHLCRDVFAVRGREDLSTCTTKLESQHYDGAITVFMYEAGAQERP